MTQYSAFDAYLLQGNQLLPQEKEKLKIVSAEFGQPSYVDAETTGVQSKLEYCLLNRNGGSIHSPIFYVPGLSASYRGAESLVKLLAIKTQTPIVVISKPNSGLSGNLPSQLRSYSDFHVYSELIFDLIKKVMLSWAEQGRILQSNKVHLIGSSLAGPIITQLAHSHPYIIQSLTLIHPVSEKNEYSITVGSRYVPQMLDQLILSGQRDPLVAIVNAIIKKDALANNTTAQRLAWRLWEMHTATNGTLPENLAGNPFPALCIAGEKDKLVPPAQVKVLESMHPKNVDFKMLPGMCHYSPYWSIFEYSQEIIRFLNENRTKRYTTCSFISAIVGKLKKVLNIHI